MIKIKMYDLGANAALDIVHELRSMDFVINRDFDFEYVPSVWDNFSIEPPNRQHIVFTFYNENLASWFRLKYE